MQNKLGICCGYRTMYINTDVPSKTFIIGFVPSVAFVPRTCHVPLRWLQSVYHVALMFQVEYQKLYCICVELERRSRIPMTYTFIHTVAAQFIPADKKSWVFLWGQLQHKYCTKCTYLYEPSLAHDLMGLSCAGLVMLKLLSSVAKFAKDVIQQNCCVFL